MAEIVDIFNIEPSVISRDLKGKYLLLYGRPKVGKTSFAVQAPRALVCAFEVGTNALANVKVQKIDKWLTFKKVVKQLSDPKAKDYYDTVVIDTVSIAYNLCEKYVIQQNAVQSIRDIEWGQGWGLVKDEFSETLRQITMLGFGIILICHSKERKLDIKDEEGNDMVCYEPDLNKNAYQICNALCDVIGYIGTEFDPNNPGDLGTRYLYTRQTPTIFAGSRYEHLEPKIRFGYTELVNAIADAIEKSVAIDGAVAVDHVDNKVVTEKMRPFKEAMNEAKLLWTNHLNGASNDEEAEFRFNALNDIVKRAFGKEIKLSTVVPSQQELLELVIEEMREL